jgi:hypothetical protein
MGGVSPLQSNVPRVLPQDAINDIGMQRPACIKAFAVVTHRPEEWSFDIITVFCAFKIVTDALGCLRVNSEASLLAAFAQFLAVCRRSKWSKHLTNSPRLALLAMAGSKAACKISSACSKAFCCRKLRRN